MPKILFFNGPSRSGKDFAANLLSPEVIRFALADDLKTRFEAAFGYTSRPKGRFKDHPMLPPFAPVTYRQGLISFSENFMKPTFGEAIFGDLLLDTIIQYTMEHHCPKAIFAITDSGFSAEAKPIVEYFGKESCALVRLHREGCSFLGDSRSYLSHESIGACQTFFVENPGEQKGFLAALGPALSWARKQ